jgi:small nuclear ribonucleoprotein (snRNP)-like protein
MNHKEERYDEELEKCINQEVEVIDQQGREYKGKLIAYNRVHLNVILMTNDEKIIIRNVANIKRKRRRDDVRYGNKLYKNKKSN